MQCHVWGTLDRSQRIARCGLQFGFQEKWPPFNFEQTFRIQTMFLSGSDPYCLLRVDHGVQVQQSTAKLFEDLRFRTENVATCGPGEVRTSTVSATLEPRRELSSKELTEATWNAAEAGMWPQHFAWAELIHFCMWRWNSLDTKPFWPIFIFFSAARYGMRRSATFLTLSCISSQRCHWRTQPLGMML